jgi:quercetin dioxygenase-like cupin family protein
MPVIRSFNVPTVEFEEKRVELVATPETGATEVYVLRGFFAAGSGNPLHSHDHQEIVVLLTGSGRYIIGDETTEVFAGDVVLVPVGVIHAFEAVEESEAIGVFPAGTKTFAPDGSELE